MTAAALHLVGISKRYGAVTALADVSLTLRPGTVHALLGENGAGKSSLMHVAFGLVRPDAGRVVIGERVRVLRSPADAIAAGVGMVHQHFTLVPAMTVAENVALGGTGRLRLETVRAALREVALRTGFVLDANAHVDTLGVGAQQRVEIAKALVRRARVLILDEPTAVLAPAEADELLRWLRAFVADGNAAVLITHKLREALSVADDVTVLRHGRVVSTGRAADASAASLTAAMIGEELARPVGAVPESRGPQRVVFHADRVTVCDDRGVVRVRDASFTVHGGEIVGVAGVEWSGERELLRALAGRCAIASGRLTRPPVVGFVPEDRHRDAMLPERPLAENVALRDAGARRGLIDWAALGAHTSQLVRAFDVRAPGSDVPMRTLSGGNQQKLVLARELEPYGRADDGPQPVVVENPTRGLDVRATVEVHARLRQARDAGAAVVVYSSDLDEVLALASRVLVTHAGAVREVALDRDAVGRAMVGL